MMILDGLTKSYKTKHSRHYVFKDLSLEIPPGKSVGLLGRNGAGKSTLLRIMGGIDHPDKGKVICDKSISWPVGLLGGFQGSLTGRENAKFVCRLYAKPHEIAKKIDFIQDFAEIGNYFDMPVKSYSSGMGARLKFGISMAFDFDYYLLDEITAVGDAHFKKKSADLLAHKRSKSNFFMVSHDLANIKKFCDIALLLGHGEARIYDNIDEAIKVYLKNEAHPTPA